MRGWTTRFPTRSLKGGLLRTGALPVAPGMEVASPTPPTPALQMDRAHLRRPPQPVGIHGRRRRVVQPRRRTHPALPLPGQRHPHPVDQRTRATTGLRRAHAEPGAGKPARRVRTSGRGRRPSETTAPRPRPTRTTASTGCATSSSTRTATSCAPATHHRSWPPCATSPSASSDSSTAPEPPSPPPPEPWPDAPDEP